MPAAFRRVGALIAVAVVLIAPGCLAGRFAADLGARIGEPGELSDGPEIDLWIRGPGDGDAIDVYLAGPSSDRRRIAESVASWLGFAGLLAHDHPAFEDTSTVELDGRLIEPAAGDTWRLDLDPRGLARVLVSAGYRNAALVVCTPPVETQVRATRLPDIDGLDTICDRSGRGWTLRAIDGELPRIEMTFVPDTADYLAYGAAVLLGTVVLGGLAWWLGATLRDGSFRRRSAASVAIGLIGGAAAAIGLASATAGAGAVAGPADNLALARDLTTGGFAASVLFPALVAAVPGIIFGTMLVRRRVADREPRGMASTPPAPPGPPPLPWS